MARFQNSSLEEQETIINIDYAASELSVYTCRKYVYDRLIKKIGQPTKVIYTSKKISGGRWNIPFTNKKTITQILSRPTLIGNKQ